MSGYWLIPLGVVCTPFYLLPTFCALMGRKRWRWAILALNLVLPAAGVLIVFPILGMWLALATALALWLFVLHLGLQKDLPALAEIDEDVVLVPYDPSWPEMYTRERARIAATFALPDDALEHIGSTAVPGLSAKPVIDMMLGVAELPPDSSLLSRLGILGYQNLGEAGVPNRWYLRLREQQAFNLHIVLRGREHWTSNLALRELLRGDAAARERYAQGKLAALEKGGQRLLGYSAAKNAVVDELLASARAR